MLPDRRRRENRNEMKNFLDHYALYLIYVLVVGSMILLTLHFAPEWLR